MNHSDPKTVEQVLFERMGVSVEDLVAAGTDYVDEEAVRAADAGIEIDHRLSGLGTLIEKLTEPDTVSALLELLDRLPTLAKLVKLSNELPQFMAMLANGMEDYQQRCAADGIELEKAVRNGLRALLYLGSNVDDEQVQRIGDLLATDILNPPALHVMDKVAKSLDTAQQQLCTATPERVGMLGLLNALRDPQMQHSLAFAVQFGKCFGRNLNSTMGVDQDA